MLSIQLCHMHATFRLFDVQASHGQLPCHFSCLRCASRQAIIAVLCWLLSLSAVHRHIEWMCRRRPKWTCGLLPTWKRHNVLICELGKMQVSLRRRQWPHTPWRVYNLGRVYKAAWEAIQLVLSLVVWYIAVSNHQPAYSLHCLLAAGIIWLQHQPTQCISHCQATGEHPSHIAWRSPSSSQESCLLQLPFRGSI